MSYNIRTYVEIDAMIIRDILATKSGSLLLNCSKQ